MFKFDFYTDHWWKINWEDLTFVADKTSGSRKSNVGSRKSNVSLLSESSYKKDWPSATSAMSSMNTTMANVSGVLCAHYNGNKVAVKPINIKKVHVNRTLLCEMKQLKEVMHDNLVRFIGIVTESPNISYVSDLCIRGCLRGKTILS